MLDLRDGGKTCLLVNVSLGEKKETLPSLIDEIGWGFARESADTEKKTEYVDTMRVWEAFAGVKLAQEKGALRNKETSKAERCGSAALLYKKDKHFNLLKALLAEYKGDLNKLEHELEQCYIKGGTPNATLQQVLIVHFAIPEAKAETGDYVSSQINSRKSSGVAPSSMSTTRKDSSSSSGALSFLSEGKNLIYVLQHQKKLIKLFTAAAKNIGSSQSQTNFFLALRDLSDKNIDKLNEERAEKIKELAEQAETLVAAPVVEEEALSM